MGAIAVLGVFADRAGELDGFIARAGLGPLEVGEARLRDLLGVDGGIAVRWTDRRLDLMPHGGPMIVRRLSDAVLGVGSSFTALCIR